MRKALFSLLAALVVGCGGGAEPPGATNQGLVLLPPIPIPIGIGYIYEFNAGWDRFDPGPMYAMPSVATDGGTWEMAYVGAGHVYLRESRDGVHFGAPLDLGYGFSGTPAVAVTHGNILVAAVNAYGQLQTRFRTGANTWDASWTMHPGQLSSPGVTIALTNNAWRYHIFGVGTDGALWERSGIGGLWNDWVSRGGSLAINVPSATSWGGERIDVLASDPNQVPVHEWQDNGVFGGWDNLGGQYKAYSQPAIAARGSGQLELFAIGSDDAVYQKTFDGRWYDWHRIADCAQHLGVIAAAPTLGGSTTHVDVDVYVQGFDHAALWHNRYGTHPSATPGPQPYCCGLPGRGCCAAGDNPEACLGQSGQATYCNPADNKCEQCGSAVGEACCTMVDAGGPRPMCGYGLTGTVCNIYSNRCDSAGGPAGGPYQLCKAGGVCDPGNSCVGRNEDRGIAGYCKPNPQPSCSAAGGGCSNANCCSGLQCISGKCAAPSGARTCGGNPVGPQTQAFTIGVRYPSSLCAVTELWPYANSQAEAVGCARALYPGYDILAGQSYTSFPYAEHSPFGTCNDLSVSAFSQSDADACAQSLCVNCSDSSGWC
jgi:hypothetical protein